MTRDPVLRLLAASVLVGTLAPGLAAGATAQIPPPVDPAQHDTIGLPELVVTATRVPLPRQAIPNQVTVLTGDQLREAGTRTVADALRGVPGVTIARAGSPGAQTSIFLRGGQSDYVKVLVDGVPANDPGGSIDLADLSTDHIDRIEIVRGPVSVLYGSDAVAGVVQVFTQRGRGAPTVTVTALGGVGERRPADNRYGAVDTDASVSGAAGPLGYSFGGSRFWTGGAYAMNNDRRHDVLSGRLDWRAAAGSARPDVSLTMRLSDSDTGLPTDGAGNLVDENARLHRQVRTVGLDAAQRLGGRVQARLQLGLLDRDQTSIDEPDSPVDTLGVFASRLDGSVRRVHADGRVDVDLPWSTMSLGLVVEQDRGSSAYTSDSEWGPTEATAEFDRGNRGYYAQILAEPVTGLHLTAGGRVDDNDTFGTFRTYRIGATHSLNATRFRAALGRGFKEPTFAESFGSGFGDVGNASLAPERSRSWEATVEQDLGSFAQLGVTWFDQRFADLIQFTGVTPEPGAPNYFNVGAAVARGLELNVTAVLLTLDLAGSYTHLRTRVVDPGLATDASFAEGEPLLRRPAHSASVSARHPLADGFVGVTAHRVGARDDLDFGAGFPAPRRTLDAHTTVNLTAEQRLPYAGRTTTLLLRVDNLFDADYQEIVGFPAPGRLIFLGARIRLGEG